MTDYTLSNLKPLTSTQYDAARQKALARVEARIGQKPTRKQFQREYAPLLTVLDVLALVVFVAALLISTTHILQYVQGQAATAYHFDGDGINMTLTDFTSVKQIGAIALAEAAVVLFGTMHALTPKRGASVLRHVSFPLVIAALSTLFVFVANISGGGDLLFALLPPVTTLGLSLRMESIVSELLKRRIEIDGKYRAALDVWEAASADPAQHPEFQPLLRAEIWSSLSARNRDFADAPMGFRRIAVRRELERETWAYSDGEQPPGERVNGHWSDANPLAAAPAPTLTLATEN